MGKELYRSYSEPCLNLTRDRLITLVEIVISSGKPPRGDPYHIYSQYLYGSKLTNDDLRYLLNLYRPRNVYCSEDYILYTYPRPKYN